MRWSCQKEVSEFQGISSQSDPSRPEAIYFRVTAWLDNFSSVSSSQHILKPFTSWKKKHLINRSTKMQCLNWQLRFIRALQPTYPARQSESNYDFCENCSSLDKWSLLKIGLVRWSWSLAKKRFQSFRVYQANLYNLFQAYQRPFISFIYFRVPAWLDNFSSVRGMYSFLWEQQQKKKHLINRSTKMQCLNWRLRFIRALQPTYPARQSESNYDFCENCSSLDLWSLLKIGLVRWSCQKKVSEFQGIYNLFQAYQRPFISFISE